MVAGQQDRAERVVIKYRAVIHDGWGSSVKEKNLKTVNNPILFRIQILKHVDIKLTTTKNAKDNAQK
jgi:hypothetical protein